MSTPGALLLLIALAAAYGLAEATGTPSADDIVAEATMPMEDLMQVPAGLMETSSETSVMTHSGGDTVTEKGSKTWHGHDQGTWGAFWAGHLNAKAPNGGAKAKPDGGFDGAKWCSAKGDGKCGGDWTQIAFDRKEVIKGVVIQGWGDSCVNKFTASSADEDKFNTKFDPVDGGAAQTSTACSGDTKKTVLFKKPAYAKFLKLALNSGKGSCCLRWSALVLTGQARTDYINTLSPTWGALKSTCKDAGTQGFHINRYCSHSKIGFLVGESDRWDRNKVYRCPAGWHWMTAASYESWMRARGCFGNNAHAARGGHAMYSRCGQNGYTFPGDSRSRYYIRFSDSKSNNKYQHAGNYPGYVSTSSAVTQFGGIACKKD